MKKEKVDAYVDKTIKWIAKKGHLIFDVHPNIIFEGALMEYIFMATRLRIYERAVEVYNELKKHIPDMQKLNSLIGGGGSEDIN